LAVLRLSLKYRKTMLLLDLAFLLVTFPLMFRMGSQFMPPLLGYNVGKAQIEVSAIWQTETSTGQIKSCVPDSGC
jgi:Cu/Ag efflux pump CusA